MHLQRVEEAEAAAGVVHLQSVGAGVEGVEVQLELEPRSVDQVVVEVVAVDYPLVVEVVAAVAVGCSF